MKWRDRPLPSLFECLDQSEWLDGSIIAGWRGNDWACQCDPRTGVAYTRPLNHAGGITITYGEIQTIPRRS